MAAKIITLQLQNVRVEATFDEPEYAQDKGLDGPLFVRVNRVSDSSTHNIGSFQLSPMPGCCGIVVSHNAFLSETTRNSGLSQPFRDIKERVAKHFGYSFMIATNDLSNVAGTISMIRSKYRFVESFINSRTGHLVGVGVKKL